MRSRKPRAATGRFSSAPNSNCPATPPCADRAIDTSLSASRLPPVRPAQSGCRPCSVHSAVYASAISALPGVWMPPSWWVRATPSARAASLQRSVPPRHPAVATSDWPPAGPDVSCCSAPWYGGRRCPPGRCLDRRLPGPGGHPLSIPFDGSCPYPLHPRQILDVFEGAVLSPVRDDRFGLHRPHVRQSLLQRRRIRRIDVDPIGREGHSAQQQSQHQRPARKPRSHCVAPCGSEPAPAGNPVEGSSVPRHIHTAYRPQRLHTAGLTPDVV